MRMDYKTANEMIAILAELYPQTFVCEKWQPHKPLKIGIDRDLIVSGALTEPEVSAVLWHYCGRYQYFIGVARGGARLDLNGQACGEVTPSEQELARLDASHVEALVENRFREASAQHKPQPVHNVASKTPPKPQHVRAVSKPVTVVTIPRQRLGLSDLRRLGHERKTVSA